LGGYLNVLGRHQNQLLKQHREHLNAFGVKKHKMLKQELKGAVFSITAYSKTFIDLTMRLNDA
jgi:hypothetical protein